MVKDVKTTVILYNSPDLQELIPNFYFMVNQPSQKMSLNFN